MNAKDAKRISYEKNKKKREEEVTAILTRIEKYVDEGKFEIRYDLTDKISPDVIEEIKKMGYIVSVCEEVRNYKYIISW